MLPEPEFEPANPVPLVPPLMPELPPLVPLPVAEPALPVPPLVLLPKRVVVMSRI